MLELYLLYLEGYLLDFLNIRRLNIFQLKRDDLSYFNHPKRGNPVHLIDYLGHIDRQPAAFEPCSPVCKIKPNIPTIWLCYDSSCDHKVKAHDLSIKALGAQIRPMKYYFTILYSQPLGRFLHTIIIHHVMI